MTKNSQALKTISQCPLSIKATLGQQTNSHWDSNYQKALLAKNKG